MIPFESERSMPVLFIVRSVCEGRPLVRFSFTVSWFGSKFLCDWT